MTPRFCLRHGPSRLCFVGEDGAHYDRERCRCNSWAPCFCPIPEHRNRAGRP